MSLLIPYWLLQVIRHLSAQHLQLEVVVVVGGGNDIDHRRGRYLTAPNFQSLRRRFSESVSGTLPNARVEVFDPLPRRSEGYLRVST